MTRRTIAFLAALLAAAAVQAEVRVVSRNGVAMLDVRPTSSGVWTPHHQPGHGHSLNPLGDLHGDSHPSHLATGDSVVVAWLRPSGQAFITEANASGELWRSVLDAPGAVGSPLLTGMGASRAIAWSTDGDEPGVQLAYQLEDGEISAANEVDTGSLVGLVPHQDGALLIVRDDVHRELRVWSIIEPLPTPIPIQRVIVTPLTYESSRGTVAMTEAARPCVTPTADMAIIEWRSGPGTVKSLTIHQGVAGDVMERRGGNPCQNGVNRAR